MPPCACAVVTRVIASNACNRWSNFLCGDSPNKARDNHKAMGRAVTLRSLSKDGDLGLAVAWIDPYYLPKSFPSSSSIPLHVVECSQNPSQTAKPVLRLIRLYPSDHMTIDVAEFEEKGTVERLAREELQGGKRYLHFRTSFSKYLPSSVIILTVRDKRT